MTKLKGRTEKMNEAKERKNDEFYTLLPDIENEVEKYKEHLLGKVIYCNCDDHRYSNFFVYFRDNFKRLGIKKLITTCYIENGNGLYSEYSGTGEVIKKELDGDGDFRGAECVEILKKADIVATNPPFSLFRDFVPQILNYGKHTIVLGNLISVHYNVIYPLIKNNTLKLGFNTFKGGCVKFKIVRHANNGYAFNSIIDKESKVVSVPARWFTTLPIIKKYRNKIFQNKYVEGQFHKYVNYDAINVDRSIDIPMDYEGEMGVPLSFVDHYNPDQWEITGMGEGSFFTPKETYDNQALFECLAEAGCKGITRKLDVLMLDYKPIKNYYPMYKKVETGELFYAPYVRLLVRNKKPLKDDSFKFYLGAF